MVLALPVLDTLLGRSLYQKVRPENNYSHTAEQVMELGSGLTIHCKRFRRALTLRRTWSGDVEQEVHSRVIDEKVNNHSGLVVSQLVIGLR